MGRVHVVPEGGRGSRQEDGTPGPAGQGVVCGLALGDRVGELEDVPATGADAICYPKH